MDKKMHGQYLESEAKGMKTTLVLHTEVLLVCRQSQQKGSHNLKGEGIT